MVGASSLHVFVWARWSSTGCAVGCSQCLGTPWFPPQGTRVTTSWPCGTSPAWCGQGVSWSLTTATTITSWPRAAHRLARTSTTRWVAGGPCPIPHPSAPAPWPRRGHAGQGAGLCPGWGPPRPRRTQTSSCGPQSDLTKDITTSVLLVNNKAHMVTLDYTVQVPPTEAGAAPELR